MEMASKQKDKMIVRLERRVEHSATQIQKSNDNAAKRVAQAHVKTDEFQAKNMQLKGDLEVKTPSPTPTSHEPFCDYTGHSAQLNIDHHYGKQEILLRICLIKTFPRH